MRPDPTRAPTAALLVAACAALLAGAAPAAAQLVPEVRPEGEATVTRYRGTVVSADNERLTIRRPGGSTLGFAMNPRTRVYAVTPAAIRDIKPESYLSVVGAAGTDPRRASAVTLYSPSERGFEAGDRPWDTAPGARITGGWVTDLDRARPLRVSLSYGGGRAEFAVPAGTPVTQIAPGEKAMLRPGAAVTVFAQPGPDGALEAGAVAAGRRGAVPGL